MKFHFAFLVCINISANAQNAFRLIESSIDLNASSYWDVNAIERVGPDSVFILATAVDEPAFGDVDSYFALLNDNMMPYWERVEAGRSAHDAVVTSGGSIYTLSGNPGAVYKWDVSGNLLWSKQLSAAPTFRWNVINDDGADGVILTSTEGASGIHVARLDGSGNLLWWNSYGCESIFATAACVKTDGTFVFAGAAAVVGDTCLAQDPAYLVVNIDAAGNLLSNTILSSFPQRQPSGQDALTLFPMANGNVVLFSSISPFVTPQALYSVTFDQSGQLITALDHSCQAPNDPIPLDLFLTGAVPTASNSYLLGTSERNGIEATISLKLGSMGNVTHANSMVTDSSGFITQLTPAAVRTNDSLCVVRSNANSNIPFISFSRSDSTGAAACDNISLNCNAVPFIPTSTSASFNGNPILNSISNSIANNVLPVQGVYTNVACSSISTSIVRPLMQARINLFPNPAHEQIQLSGFEGVHEFRLYDIAGNLLHTERISSGMYWDIGAFSNGIYLVRCPSLNWNKSFIRKD